MDTDIDPNVRLRVIHGMALLDPMWPDHVRRADLDTMDCADLWNCPLAQAANCSYDSAYKAIGFLNWEAAFQRGFVIAEWKGATTEETEEGSRQVILWLDDYTKEYALLTRAWKEAYSMRRNKDDAVWTEYVHSLREQINGIYETARTEAIAFLEEHPPEVTFVE